MSFSKIPVELLQTIFDYSYNEKEDTWKVIWDKKTKDVKYIFNNKCSLSKSISDSILFHHFYIHKKYKDYDTLKHLFLPYENVVTETDIMFGSFYYKSILEVLEILEFLREYL